jgi:hypothetical protein
MLKTVTESGHLKNLTTFNALITLCKGYDSKYDPGRPAIKMNNLLAIYTEAKVIFVKLKKATSDFYLSASDRDISFSNVKSLSERIIDVLTSSGIKYDGLDQVRIINRRVFGRSSMAKRLVPPTPTVSNHDESALKNISLSQMGFERLVNRLEELYNRATSLPGYNPYEKDLTLESIRRKIVSLKAANKDVVNAFNTLSQRRFLRDTLFYINHESLVAIAQDVKLYVHSIFGEKSEEFREVSKLIFAQIKKDGKLIMA